MDMIKQITLRIGKAFQKALAFLKRRIPVCAATAAEYCQKAKAVVAPLFRKAAARIVPLCRKGLGFAQKNRVATACIGCVLTLSMLMSVVTVTIRKIRVYDGETEVHSYYAIRTDEASILEESGLTLLEGDLFTLSEEQGTITATVTRAFPVSVFADGYTTTLKMAGGTVAEALVKAGVSLGSEDKMNMQPGDAVFSGLKIEIDRVKSEVVTETVSIDYKTIKEETDSLYVGQTKVKQKGEKGEKIETYRVTYTNGEESHRELTHSEITREPVDKIVLVGTKVKSTFLKTSSTPTSYKKVIAMTATAYKAGGYTASGRPAEWGVVAVDPNVIPLGTKVYVESEDGKYIYGTAVAADTGGAIKGNKIDLCLNTSAECRKFGRRTVNVYILE